MVNLCAGVLVCAALVIIVVTAQDRWREWRWKRAKHAK